MEERSPWAAGAGRAVFAGLFLGNYVLELQLQVTGRFENSEPATTDG